MSATSGKWALPILDCLVDGGSRYNRLLESLDPISHKVLTQTLRRLEVDGLILCEPVGRHGRRYRLTECGRLVRDRLSTLRELAAEMAGYSGGPVPGNASGARPRWRHSAIGSPPAFQAANPPTMSPAR
jgi:DNA-binding HxlR family transcriptional regulator